MSRSHGFTLAGQWGMTALLALLCLVIGFTGGRPDVVALGLPFVLLSAAGLRSRSVGRVDVTIVPVPRRKETEDRQRLAVRSSGGDAAVLVYAASPGHRPLAVVIRTGAEAFVETDVPLSGKATVLNCSVSAMTFDATAQQEPAELPEVGLTVLPRVQQAPSLPLPARLRGLTGEHTSRLPGEGGELRDIYPFQPGDQLRRIDWRTTARQSTDQDRLFVRRTFATSDASVQLLVDHAFDYPAETRQWFTSRRRSIATVGSLHLAREAATLIAASYLNHGDRVGLAEISGLHHPLRAAAGRRQLELIRTRLANLQTAPRGERLSRDLPVPNGALLYVFSPFMDDESVRLMRKWHRSGHRVIGVDTLPELVPGLTDRAEAMALQLSLLQRRHGVDQLRSDGIAVLGWRGPGSHGAAGTAATAGGAPEPAAGLDSVPGQLPLPVGLADLRRRYAKTTSGAAGDPR